MRKLLWFAAPLALLLPVAASAADWEVNIEESEVTAIGVLNGKERTISFEDYEALVAFDPDDLASSTISITFDITKIEDPLDFTGDVVATMMDPTWFDGENITNASFTSEQITETSEGSYEALGTLTIKNISKPVTVPFAFESLDDRNAVAVTEGIVLKRMDYELGKGWDFPGYTVDDEVTVKFRLVAGRAAE